VWLSSIEIGTQETTIVLISGYDVGKIRWDRRAGCAHNDDATDFLTEMPECLRVNVLKSPLTEFDPSSFHRTCRTTLSTISKKPLDIGKEQRPYSIMRSCVIAIWLSRAPMNG